MNTPGSGYPNFTGALRKANAQRGLLFGGLIITALLAFEIFNYSTTEFALSDLLGDLRFAGVTWSTILAIAFCGIDFAGIARLFTPTEASDEPSEAWYLFGAWMLAATMNALLTWWGVSLAIANNPASGNAVIDRATLLKVVPIFVAVMVWVIRVLIIGTFSMAGDRLFGQTTVRAAGARVSALNRAVPGIRKPETSVPARPVSTSLSTPSTARPPSRPVTSPTFRPAPRPATPPEPSGRPEPSYHPMGRSPGEDNPSNRRQL